MDYDHILDVLTTLAQGMQTQTKEMHNYAKEMQNQTKEMGEIVEFMEQIQEQSCMEVGDDPTTAKPSQNMDEQWLLEEEEDDKTTTSLEDSLPQPTLAPPPLPQPSKDPPPPNSSKVSILSNHSPPNVLIPCRFLQFNEEEGEKDIFEAFPNIQEKEVAGDCLELIKEDVLATTIPNEVEFYDTGQVTTLKTPNLAELSNPKSFEVVFVLEFLSNHIGKPPPRISISFYTNMLLMIQAPTLEFKPLPDHFKYHLPFKDKGGIV